LRIGEEKKKIEDRKKKKPQDKNVMASLFHKAAINRHVLLQVTTSVYIRCYGISTAYGCHPTVAPVMIFTWAI